MRKLLSLFSALTILGASGSVLTACGAPNGKPLPFYVYNNDSVTQPEHNPDAQGNVNNIYDGYKNTDDYQFQAAMQAASYQNQISLSSNALIPLLAGLNLSTDNTSRNTNGAKWSNNQFSSSLLSQKTNLEAQKAEWKNFFTSFSSQEDTYFTQIGVLKENNKSLVLANNIITKVANFDKIGDKKLISNLQLTPTLFALSPVAVTESYLTTNLNLSKADNNDFLVQNAAYALLSIGDLTVNFEFTGLHKYWTFAVTLHNLAARFNFLAYKNPDTSDTNHTYIHQWFFTGYDFYSEKDFAKAYDGNVNKNNKVTSDNPKLAIGYVNADDSKPNNTNYQYTKKPDIKNNAGMFSHSQIPDTDLNISFPWLTWDIQLLIIEVND